VPPRSLARAANIADLRALSRRRLARAVFDYYDGGADDEHGLDRNREAFRRLRLVPRYLVDVAGRDASVTLFGRRYAAPFGIAPCGLAGAGWPGADLALAEASAAADIPFVLSGVGTATLEEVARRAPKCWYQLYPARDAAVSQDMVRRARDAGIGVLVLTVDVPATSNRERDVRHGFVGPYKLTLAAMLEALRHPGWLADYLRHGPPLLANWADYAPRGASAREVAAYYGTQAPVPMTWAQVEDYRRLWPGQLVLKGVLHPDDARRAADLGLDGVIVSNHGGRQLDAAPASIEALPAIRAAVGERLTVMLDSGIRRGSDIVAALALGAQFTFVGRPTLYGVTAAGRPGAERAIAILRREVDLMLAQLGCPTPADLGPGHLMTAD
jgi:L-lactate dehydrogenase (cytochrome)/(S)-mandelate dehydrogenase